MLFHVASSLGLDVMKDSLAIAHAFTWSSGDRGPGWLRNCIVGHAVNDDAVQLGLSRKNASADPRSTCKHIEMKQV